jgi:formylglycine-generating enzyme
MRSVSYVTAVTACMWILAVPVAAAQITYEMVTVGDPGNAADDTGYGAVTEPFRIMTYELTNQQYVEFLNSVAATDNYLLYQTEMDRDAHGGITRSGVSGSYSYAVKLNMGDKPVNFVSWFDAARMSNWLHNGANSSSSTESGAYTLVGGQTVGTPPSANAAAKFFIPSEDQWYKAAYFKGGSTHAGYWDFPTQDDIAPTAVTADMAGNGSAGDMGNFANFDFDADWNSLDGNVTTVGTNGGSSTYGAYDMGGNVSEWISLTDFVGLNTGLRGGNFNDANPSIHAYSLSSSCRIGYSASAEEYPIGFRLASPLSASSVPEIDPNSLGSVLALVLGSLGLLERRRLKVAGSSTRQASEDSLSHSHHGITGTTITVRTSLKILCIGLCAIACLMAAHAPSGAAQITYEMVTVGDPVNAADTRPGDGSFGYGSVSYSYQIGKYDVTIGQYAAFLNAADPNGANPNGIYNSLMGTDLNVAGIAYDATASHGLKYSVMNNGGDSATRPITHVSWFDTARFANWMTNGQGSGSTETGAYTLGGATSGDAVAANPGASFRLPTVNEWYKAAYYSPNYGGPGVPGYYAYATQSDTVPANIIGSDPNQANYYTGFGFSVTQSADYDPNQNYLTDVGAFSGSGSFYGTFDQNGNVSQWNDLDGTAGSMLRVRGEFWNTSNAFLLSSSYRDESIYPNMEDGLTAGFRLASPASVPEIDPNSLGSVLALVLGSLGLLERRRLKAA